VGQKIIAQMVGRNEASRFLPEVLERLKNQVDKIVFTDDCSTDNTADIARDYAHVYRTEEPTFSIHEGRLREYAWANLKEHANEGDWIIAIDCDEMLYGSSDISNVDIRDILNKSEKDVVNVRFYHMWNEKQYRVDKLWAPNNSNRIFRYMSGGKFRDRVLACGAEPTYVSEWMSQGNFWVNSSLIMQHLGYVRDEDKASKYERYSNLDGGKYHNGNHINSIIDKDPVLINWGNLGI